MLRCREHNVSTLFTVRRLKTLVRKVLCENEYGYFSRVRTMAVPKVCNNRKGQVVFFIPKLFIYASSEKDQ
jgi:hypothetical protein